MSTRGARGFPAAKRARRPQAGSAAWDYLFWAAAAVLFGWYAVALHWSAGEIARFAGGTALLWGPAAALVHVALRRAVPDAVVRGSLSCVTSYALTTLLYFGCAVLSLPWAFYVGLAGMGAGTVWELWRREARIELPRPGPVLIALVAASLALTVPYSTAFKTDPSGSRELRAFPDHFYHVGLENELGRHVPPRQATIRGGTAERAYHMFPHLTAMLIARFTGQPDMIRAHIVYHYAVMTVLVSLALYGIGFLLTGRRTGGYATVSMAFLFAIAWPPCMPNGVGYFFFTVFPHATSTLIPTLLTSPQMYSGITVVYGAMLAVAAIVSRPARRAGAILPVICGLLVAALLRFRVHCWIVMLPVFLAFAAAMWRRTRSAAWVAGAGSAIVVTTLLYVEMRSPVYLHGTVSARLGFNDLVASIGFYNSWPFAALLRHTAGQLLSGAALDWVWQIVAIAGFSIFDMIGVPLLLAALIAVRLLDRRGLRGYPLVTIGMVCLSIVCAACVSMDYDKYSVPSQLIYHTGWYVLPLAGIVVGEMAELLQQRVRYARLMLLSAAVLCGFASAATQRPLSSRIVSAAARRRVGAASECCVVPAASWEAFQYLKRHTPDGSIVLSTSPLDRGLFLISAAAARSAYLEFAGNPVDQQALMLHPNDDRSAVLRQLEAAQTPGPFCTVLTHTPITHVLEEASFPLRIRDAPCLRRLWTASDGTTAVWEVARPGGR